MDVNFALFSLNCAYDIVLIEESREELNGMLMASFRSVCFCL